MFKSLVWGMPAGIIFGITPWFWLSARRRKRLRKIEEQLPAAVDMMVRGLKAGLALTACMKNVSDEMIGPLAEEFEKTNAEYALGKDISDCLEAMSERTGSQDVQFFSTAIRIQRETGGNLAEVLDNISHITRERFALRRHVRTLTGEGRLSAIILLALPRYFSCSYCIFALSIYWDSSALKLEDIVLQAPWELNYSPSW